MYFRPDEKVLVVRLKGNCSILEFDAIRDALTERGQLAVSVHDWCFLTGVPPQPEPGELFRYAYLIAHGDQMGCNFCSDAEKCMSMQVPMETICAFLAPDAVVVGACCWCGSKQAATQIACKCSAAIAEVVGPLAKVGEREMHSLAEQFFRGLATGDRSPAEVVSDIEGLSHHYTADLDGLSDCIP